jgi:hypothetical protein
MGAATSPKAVREVIKIFLVDGFQQHRHRPLDDLVLKRWFAYRTFLTIFLFEPATLYRRCFVPPVSQSLVEGWEVGFQILGVLFRRDPVDPRRTPLVRPPVGLPKEFYVDMVR